jgi:hypothetical protein
MPSTRTIRSNTKTTKANAPIGTPSRFEMNQGPRRFGFSTTLKGAGEKYGKITPIE